MRSEYDLQKVTKGHPRSTKVKNRHYTQIKGNRECDRKMTSKEVNEGHPRSRKVKNEFCRNFDDKSRGGSISGGWAGHVCLRVESQAGAVPAAVGRVFLSILTRSRVSAIVHIVRVHLRSDLRPCRRRNLLLFICVH